MHLADFIHRNREAILKEWESFARTLLPAAGGMSKVGLRDHADEILTAIVADMESLQSTAESTAKSKGRKPKKGTSKQGTSKSETSRKRGVKKGLGALGQIHAVLRIETGFTLTQVVAEYRALRASVFRLWKRRVDPDGVLRFNEAIDEALAEAVDRFTEVTNHYRDQLIGIVSHDLRNPLAGILMGAGALVRREELDDRGARIAGRIQNSAKRMDRIVEDLIDLTRARLGSAIPIVRRPTDVGPICEMVISELEGSHPEAVVHYGATGSLRGEWDSDRLAQVLSNLVGNALQHGDTDQPIRVTAKGDRAGVVVAVHNAGPPIPENGQRDIFDPMVRCRHDAATGKIGLGLGLYIAKELVTAHGGTIELKSSDADGTTFTVRLPHHPSRASGADVRA